MGLRLDLAPFALHHTQPPTLWLYVDCEHVRPLPKRTCCCTLEGVYRGGTALDMGLHAIRPRLHLQLVPYISIIHILRGPGVKISEFQFWHALSLKVPEVLFSARQSLSICVSVLGVSGAMQNWHRVLRCFMPSTTVKYGF